MISSDVNLNHWLQKSNNFPRLYFYHSSLKINLPEVNIEDPNSDKDGKCDKQHGEEQVLAN